MAGGLAYLDARHGDAMLGQAGGLATTVHALTRHLGRLMATPTPQLTQPAAER